MKVSSSSDIKTLRLRRIVVILILLQLRLLTQAVQLAAQLEKSVHCVLEKTKIGLQEKCHSLQEAKARLARLQHKLQCACSECAVTKQAAHCACEAARAACGNARRKKHVTNEIVLVKNKKHAIAKHGRRRR